MLNTEIASVMNEKGKVFEWASRVKGKMALTDEQNELSEVMDSFAKEVGQTGHDKDHLIAEFIKKVVEPEVDNPDDEILNAMFDMGQIGEFDEKLYNVLPKNTLKVYDAVRGGNVPKSYLDCGVFAPKSIALQTETQIKMSDLRRNGYKSIANMIVLAEEALTNEKYFRILNAVDVALAGGEKEQSITNSGTSPLETSVDELALYLNDRGENPFMIGLTKYTNRLAKMSGFTSFLSEDMKNEFNRYGKLGLYQGVKINGISGARKTGSGLTLVPDKRILGIAGKVGELDMKGELRVLQEEDINKEVINLKFTGYDMNYVIYRLDKMARIVLQ